MAVFPRNTLVSVSNTLSCFLKRNMSVMLSLVSAGVGVGLLRWYLSGATCHSRNQLHGKTAIITGSNRGVGKETARDLAKRGCRVILAVRDITKGERAANDIIQGTGNPNVVVKIVDLASLESVRKFCRHIIETENHVDILINNAAITLCPHWTSKEGHEMHLAVNHLGHFLLTDLLLGLMKKSAPSRILCVTCVSYEKGVINFEDLNSQRSYDPWTAYNQSKLANVLFSQELSGRLEGSGVTVNAVHPGIVKSETGEYTVEERKPSVLRKMLLKAVECMVMKSAEQGAQTIIHCAVSDEVENVTGKYFSDCRERKVADVAMDTSSSKLLWDVSCKKVNLHVPPSSNI